MNWIHWLIVHLSQETGTSNSSSRAYDFWSGFGSDLGEVTLIGVFVGMLRQHNCEVKGCWRLGRHATAAGHKVCRVHHPEDHLTVEHVRKAHEKAKAA